MNVAVQVSRMRRHPNPKMSIKDPTTTTTVVVSPVRAVLPPVWLYTRMILLTGGLFWRSSEDATLGFHQFGFDILHVGSPPPYRSQQQNGQWPGSHSATFQKKIKEKDVAGSLAVKDYVAIWVAMLSPGSFAAGPHPQPFLFLFLKNFFFPLVSSVSEWRDATSSVDESPSSSWPSGSARRWRRRNGYPIASQFQRLRYQFCLFRLGYYALVRPQLRPGK